MSDRNVLALPLKEFDAEMASTRKLLARVPSEKAQWKPHERSFALGHLAQLVAWIPGWITETLNPKGEQVRQHLNHFIHHRGQLTVYVRLVEVPLPMIYGPTADERWPM